MFNQAIRWISLVCFVALPIVACKGQQHGSCEMAAEGKGDWDNRDSCWVWDEQKSCRGTFVPQDSRDKSELYCSFAGYRAAKGQTGQASVMYRPHEKRNN